jgi:hypothetical protein
MKWLRWMKVSTRNLLWGGLTAIGLLIFCVVALVAIRDSMMEDRKQRIKSLVEAGTGVLAHYQQLAASGKLPKRTPGRLRSMPCATCATKARTTSSPLIPRDCST